MSQETTTTAPPQLSPIDKKLAKLEEQRKELLEKKREQERKENQQRAEQSARLKKGWEKEVTRAIGKLYPMPASEIAERLDSSIQRDQETGSKS